MTVSRVIKGEENDLHVILPGPFHNKSIQQWEHGHGRRSKQKINRMEWYEEYYRTQSVMPVILSLDSEWTISTGEESVEISHGDQTYSVELKRPGWDPELPK